MRPSERHSGRPPTGRIALMAVAAYALHFTWEMVQADWFATMQEMPPRLATAWCARAAGWDVIIGAAAYLAGALVARNLWWVREHQVARSSIAAYFLSGLAVTIAIERWALSRGRWRYADTMPTIGGIGLAPILQWIVVPAAMLIISGWAFSRIERSP